MCAFLAANLGHGEDSLSKAMALAQIARRPTDEQPFDIGLGWRVEKTTGTRLKSGSGEGFESNMLFNVEQRVGLVVLCNTYINSSYDISISSQVLFTQIMARFGYLAPS